MTASQEELEKLPLLGHLSELRRRILWAVVSFAVALVPCWTYVKKIYSFLAAPIQDLLPPGTKLAFLGVTDPFILYFKVAALAAVFAASPLILYQFWRFVSPGLYRREKLYAIPFIFFGSVFFLAGGAFAYYIAFPKAIQVLLGMGEQFMPVITIERYFGFLMTVILGLGLMFELPIVIFLLVGIGVATPGFLMRHFRYAVVIIFIVAAIITPTPDVVNLCLFAVPTLGLYLLGVVASWIAFRGRIKKRKELAAAARA